MPPPWAPELQVTNAQTHCQTLEIGPCTVPRVPPERDFYRSLIRTWTVAALPSVLPRSARSPSSRPRFNAWKPAAHTQRAVVGQRKPAAQRMRAVEGAGVQRILGIGRYRESLRRTHDLASADRAREVVRGRCAPALPRQTACGAQRRR